MSFPKLNKLVHVADAVSVVTIIAGSTMFLYGWQQSPQAPLIAFLSLQASLSGRGASEALAAGSSVGTAVGLIWWGIMIAVCGFAMMVMRYRMSR